MMEPTGGGHGKLAGGCLQELKFCVGRLTRVGMACICAYVVWIGRMPRTEVICVGLIVDHTLKRLGCIPPTSTQAVESNEGVGEQPANGLVSYAQGLKPYVGSITWLAISGFFAYKAWQRKISGEQAISLGILAHQVFSKLGCLPASIEFKGFFDFMGEVGMQQKSIQKSFKAILWFRRTIKQLIAS